jgi:omega-amidase
MPLPECRTEGDRKVVRVCSAQITSIWEDPEKTLAKIESLIQCATVCGSDIICFPEQFATGWDPCSTKNVQELDGPIVTALQSFARKYKIAILGSVRLAAQPFPKNTAIAIGNDGAILTTYSKIHLFSHARENEFFTHGTDLGTFDLGPLSCGIAICYDLRFPELFRIYAQRGVQAVFIPAAWPENRIHHWELFIKARAAENQMYGIGVNTTGMTPVDHYSGASMTADPHGTIISRASEAEQLLFSDLDPAVITAARASFPLGRDRKDELYRVLRE